MKEMREKRWKKNVTPETIHQFIRRHKPKSSICQLCLGNTCDNKKPFHLVNIKNHKYTRNTEDYRWASVKCHRALDDSHWAKGTHYINPKLLNYNLGKPHSEETKLRMRYYHIRKCKTE